MTANEIGAILRRLDERDQKDADYHRRQDLEKADLHRDVKEMAREVKTIGSKVDGALPRIGDLEEAKRIADALSAENAKQHAFHGQTMVALIGASAGSMGMLVAYLALHLIETGKL